MSYVVLTSLQIRTELWGAYPAAAFTDEVTSDRYHAVTREWVERRFAPWFWDYLRARDLHTWTLRGNQCEHFAMRALVELVTLFHQTRDARIDAGAESVAAAWVRYRRDDGLWHAVVAIRVETGWELWEPQTQQFFTPSAAECASVTRPFVL